MSDGDRDNLVLDILTMVILFITECISLVATLTHFTFRQSEQRLRRQGGNDLRVSVTGANHTSLIQPAG